MERGHLYPYTNFQDLNLDWILSKIQEFDTKWSDGLDAYIRSQLDKLFIDSMYIPETETLVLVLNMEE